MARLGPELLTIPNVDTPHIRRCPLTGSSDVPPAHGHVSESNILALHNLTFSSIAGNLTNKCSNQCIDSGDAISGFALDDSSIIITDDCNDDVSHGPSLPLNPSISADIPYISIALLSSLAASTIHPCSRMMITFATLKRVLPLRGPIGQPSQVGKDRFGSDHTCPKHRWSVHHSNSI